MKMNSINVELQVLWHSALGWTLYQNLSLGITPLCGYLLSTLGLKQISQFSGYPFEIHYPNLESKPFRIVASSSERNFLQDLTKENPYWVIECSIEA